MREKKASKSKKEREKEVLFGLIESFIATGKPVGSNSLKESGFDGFSSATIRNYFVSLEQEGFLVQLHTSGGRVPTEKAFQWYAEEALESSEQNPDHKKQIDALTNESNPEVNAFLQESAELLSRLTKSAVFMMPPQFDQDFALDIKLVELDQNRALSVVMTNFGQIHTEILHCDLKLNTFRVKHIEQYFLYRMTGHDLPEEADAETLELAKTWYNEVMVRYIVGYSQFSDNGIYKTGLSNLLNYPEIDSAARLAKMLSLFENLQGMRIILKECLKLEKLKYWIGKELLPYSQEEPDFSVIAIPYTIGQKVVGAVGLIGPLRMDYKELFATLRYFSEKVSEELTKRIYKYRITYRQPMEEQLLLPKKELLLLEDKKNG